jgi:Glycosyltransferase WbsX
MFDFEKMSTKSLTQYILSKKMGPVFPMVSVAFDNTPRYGKRARILLDNSIELFEATLREAVANTSASHPVLVNAWNEWGEGAFLQPDYAQGFARLEAVERAAKAMIVSQC